MECVGMVSPGSKVAGFFKAAGLSSKSISFCKVVPKNLSWSGLIVVKKLVPRLRASSSGPELPFGDREDGNGDWITWLVIDLTGEQRPRKNMLVRQYFRETEDVQIRAIMGGFEREEIGVVVEYGFVIIRARFNPAIRSIDLPPAALNTLFELRFLLSRNACTGRITAQAGEGLVRVVIPKKKSGGEAGKEDLDHPIFVPVTGFFSAGV